MHWGGLIIRNSGDLGARRRNDSSRIDYYFTTELFGLFIDFEFNFRSNFVDYQAAFTN